MSNSIEHMNVADIENAIHMLNEHVTETSVKALIPILEALKQDLDNESLLAQLTISINQCRCGPIQFGIAMISQ